MKDDTVILNGIGEIIIRLAGIDDKLDKFTADLSEFSDRFEEVVERMESERRADLFSLHGQ